MANGLSPETLAVIASLPPAQRQLVIETLTGGSGMRFEPDVVTRSGGPGVEATPPPLSVRPEVVTPSFMLDEAGDSAIDAQLRGPGGREAVMAKLGTMAPPVRRRRPVFDVDVGPATVTGRPSITHDFGFEPDVVTQSITHDFGFEPDVVTRSPESFHADRVASTIQQVLASDLSEGFSGTSHSDYELLKAYAEFLMAPQNAELFTSGGGVPSFGEWLDVMATFSNERKPPSSGSMWDKLQRAKGG